jgi:hypothetical protein
MSSHMNRITIFQFSMVFLGGKSGQQHDDLVQPLLCIDSRVRIYMQAATSRTVYTHRERERDVQSCSSRFTLLTICAYIASHCVSFDSRFVNNRLFFSSSLHYTECQVVILQLLYIMHERALFFSLHLFVFFCLNKNSCSRREIDAWLAWLSRSLIIGLCAANGSIDIRNVLSIS